MPIFVVLVAVCFSIFMWVLFRALQRNYFPPHNDDEGGTPVDAVFPTFDPPSGHGLDDWLVDRQPREVETPTQPVSQKRF